MALHTIGSGCQIGATRQSVNRLLVDLVDRGLVRIERDTLVIPDLERLEQLATR